MRTRLVGGVRRVADETDALADRPDAMHVAVCCSGRVTDRLPRSSHRGHVLPCYGRTRSRRQPKSETGGREAAVFRGVAGPSAAFIRLRPDDGASRARSEHENALIVYDRFFGTGRDTAPDRAE